MASKSERLITEALGVPDSDSAINISFTSTTTSGLNLSTDTTYRVVSTEDCYLRFAPTADTGSGADSNDMLLIAGVPEVFCTTANIDAVEVVRKDTDGTLQLTPMLTRGK